ncbi:MAG: NAD(P) transhydrogenase subunit alpha [Spirochaetes bacterium GWB1_48_6]|nr:MAG: NAD(P) transhydrogenase subunit alpha [Spirochaetes bacterium GWB1_48_6]
MPIIAGVPKEATPGERRVALVPAHVPSLVKAGLEIWVEAGAGLLSGYPDEEYSEKGAKIVDSFKTIADQAQIVLTVRSGAADAQGRVHAQALKPEQVIIGTMDPWGPHEAFDNLQKNKVTVFAMEWVPRTTRAQAMDVLSSQANLAGYRGVLMGADLLPKMFPMMMTAAGTIVPAKVFILGAGVAGLQAIATARRLGAVVSAFDVRSAVKEQVESLGAKFVSFDIGDASGAGGYAKELTPEQQVKQKQLMAEYVKDIDVIVTTAAIPGRPSPKLITEEMVKSMPAGSVIVDLASEKGGNCELTEPGKTVVKHNVTIAGPLNVPSTVAYHASQMYSKNICNFLGLLINKEKALVINKDDDIVAATLVTMNGLPGSERASTTLGLGGNS